jgi:cytochrome c biogenesis protein CcmG, thiol:disulfide interchange protein DsbE
VSLGPPDAPGLVDRDRRPVTRWAVLGLLLVVVVGVAVVAAVRSDGGVATAFQPQASTARGLGPAVEEVPVDLPAGPLPPLGPGPQVDLAAYAGRPLLVNFWATWCGPCVEEMPVLRDAERRLGDQIAFIGINVQDNEASALEFLAELDVTYDQARDPMAEYFTAVGGFGMPTTLLVDPDGRIVYRYTGAIEAAQLDALLAEHFGVQA